MFSVSPTSCTPCSSTWTDEETLLLINAWGNEKVQRELDDQGIRNNMVFANIAQGLQKAGYFRDGKQCATKIKHLKGKYGQYKDLLNHSGAGRETPPKFFDEIDAIIGTRPLSRPRVMYDSSAPTSSDIGNINNLSDDEENDTEHESTNANTSGSSADSNLTSRDGKRSSAPSDRETVRKAKKSKVEVSMSLFKDLLAEQSDKQTASMEAMQAQWLNLEATRLQQEEREREREREHGIQMMQMFGAMINQGDIVKTNSASSCDSSSYMELQKSFQPHSLSSYFHFN